MLGVRERTVAVKVKEARLSVYLADRDGNPIASAPVWMGARVEGLEFNAEIEEVNSTPSGARYDEYEQLGEEHQITVERIEVVQPGGQGYQARREKLVFIFYWEDEVTGIWNKRIYYWCHLNSRNSKSQGIMHFLERQVIRARFMTEAHGRLAAGAAAAPATQVGEAGGTLGSEETPLQFFHPGAMPAGDHFTGHYQFETARVVTWAKVIALASQGAATVIGLEVNGVLSAVTLTIAEGDENVEVSDEAEFSESIAAGASLRWVVVSGPAGTVDQAWDGSVSMNVKEES